MAFRVTLLSLFLALIVPLSQQKAESLDAVEALKGLQYTDLPKGLCKGLGETTLGQTGGTEYGGIICDRNDGAYILLEKLVNYTSAGKSIWQVVSVKKLSNPQVGTFLTNAVCFDNKKNPQSIFALVKDVSSQPYKVVRSWKANLMTEQVEEINPRQVACYNLALGN